MTDTAQTADSIQKSQEKPQHYRFSVLLTAIGRLFRSFVALAIVIIVNAVVQSLLVGYVDASTGFNFLYIVALVVSAAFLLWGFYCFNIVALEGATGKPQLTTVFRRTAGEWGWFTLWAALLYIVAVTGFLLSPYLAVLVLAVFPFVSLAAADTNRNPLKTNFLVLWQRIIRYIFTAIVFGIIAMVSLLLTSVTGFFIGDILGSFITWIYWGIIGAWYLNALGLIYRSTHAGAIEAKSPLSGPEQAEEAATEAAAAGESATTS